WRRIRGARSASRWSNRFVGERLIVRRRITRARTAAHAPSNARQPHLASVRFWRLGGRRARRDRARLVAVRQRDGRRRRRTLGTERGRRGGPRRAVGVG